MSRATTLAALGGATAAIALAAGLAFADKPASFTASRAAVQETCALNRGTYIDSRPESGDYGCITQSGWIWCAADGDCEGGRQALRRSADRKAAARPRPDPRPPGATGQLTAGPWMTVPLPGEPEKDDDPLARLLGPIESASAGPGS